MDNQKRILIVDDEPLIAQLCKHVLSVEGYEVLITRTGEEALDLLETADVDLMMIDLRLPGINGWDTVRAARRRLPGICAVLMTGYGSKETVIAALKVGFDDYLDKPFTSDQLVLVVQQVMERRRERNVIVQTQKLLEAERDLLESLLTARKTSEVYESLRHAARSLPGAGASLLFSVEGDECRLIGPAHDADTDRLRPIDLNGVVGKGPVALADTPLAECFANTDCSHAVLEAIAGQDSRLILCVGAATDQTFSKGTLNTVTKMARLTEQALNSLSN